MTAPWYPRDDVVVDPFLEWVDLDVISGLVDADVVTYVCHVPEVDRRRLLGVGQTIGDRGEPVPESASDPWSERARADRDRCDIRVAVSADLEFEVIDLADEMALGIDDLPIQQVQLQIEFAPL
jgi:hypothetical protein